MGPAADHLELVTGFRTLQGPRDRPQVLLGDGKEGDGDGTPQSS